MPSFSIVAVDHNTDQLTILGHSILTGDGPFVVYTPAGVLPGGIAPATDYWAIRVDNNNVKLASSSANAMAGVAVDITSNGTGPLLLHGGLPFRRPRDYVAGSQLKSADVNGVFKSFEALWNFFTGQTQPFFNGIKLPPNMHVSVSGTGRHKHGDMDIVISGAAFFPSGPNWAGTVQGFVDDWTFPGGPPNTAIVANVPLPVGARVKSIEWHLNKAGQAAGMNLVLRKRNGAASSDVSSVTDATAGGAYKTNKVEGINYTILPGDALHLRVDAGHTSHRFSHAVITYDFP